MTVATPWANKKLVPVTAHTCLRWANKHKHITFNLCFYAIPFAKNVLLHIIKDKVEAIFWE